VHLLIGFEKDDKEKEGERKEIEGVKEREKEEREWGRENKGER
jgi:hypothetical protein